MKILYFAWVREAVGKSQEDLLKPEGVNTVQDLITWLKEQDVSYQKAFADDAVVRVAVNQEYECLDCLISNTDEIAFFPPVTGG
jgi:molybdopterin synthase sulfur carrier subunit